MAQQFSERRRIRHCLGPSSSTYFLNQLGPENTQKAVRQLGCSLPFPKQESLFFLILS